MNVQTHTETDGINSITSTVGAEVKTSKGDPKNGASIT